jgi:GNAT superfamily N-acetyltransferase
MTGTAAVAVAKIELLNCTTARNRFSELVALLQDGVHDGASIGFLRPLGEKEAVDYWDSVLEEMSGGNRLVWVALKHERVVGTVQLFLCGKANGRHRAEVQKLIVHTTSRGQGIGRRLMETVENHARGLKKKLLYLDTEPGKPAETLYRKLGWVLAGSIPDYATTPDGQLHPTVIYYKQLSA